jgi:Ca-activated chloride channel family protein
VTTFTHHYHNTFENAVEATFLFPIIPEMAISQLHIQIGDHIIEGKVMELNKAQFKYDDAIAAGKSAVVAK